MHDAQYNEPFLINPPSRLGKYRLSVPDDSESFKSNPFGEELLIIGGNPKNRRRSSMLSNAWYGHRAEHASAARKGWRKRRTKRAASAGPRRRRRAVRAAAAAPVRRRRRRTQLALPFAAPRRRRRSTRRRRRSYAMSPRRRATRTRARRRISSILPFGMGSMYRANPVRRRRRSSRRLRSNPVIGRGGLIGRFTSALPLAITGGASIIATNIAPGIAARYVGTSDLAKYGVQAATAVVGGMGVSKFVGREHGTIWTVAGLAVIAADILSKHVVSRIMPSLGVGAYDTGYEMGAFPFEAVSGIGAFPEETMSGLSDGPYGAGAGPY